MLLIAHVIFALSSLPLMLAASINELFGFISKKQILPIASVLSFIGMLSTGTALVISTHQKLVGPCIEGLTYLSALAVLYLISKKIELKSVTIKK